MNIKEYMRQKALLDIYSKMSDEEKRAYMLMNSNHQEVMGALQGISQQVDQGKHSFTRDLAANVAGNAIFDTTVWLASKLLKIIK